MLISAVLFGGPPGELLEKARDGLFTAVTSIYILEEFRQVLTGKKFGFEPALAEELALEIASFSEVMPVERATGNWCDADPADDAIVETAVLGRADCIVTGDKELLKLVLKGIEILDVRGFLDSMGEPHH